MTEQKPTYDQGEDYGGQLAQHAEYGPGEQASYIAGAQLQAGEVLHVSNGPGGQIYVIENEETGFPEFILASDLAVKP